MRQIRVTAYEVFGEWRVSVQIYETDEEGTTVADPVLVWQGKTLDFDDAQHQVWAVLDTVQKVLQHQMDRTPRGPHLVR